MRYSDYNWRMNALIALALFLFSPLTLASTPWDALNEKVLRDGTLLESNFGTTKHLERRKGEEVAYFTVEINTETGEAKRYSAVIEDWKQSPDGKFVVFQSLFWFTPLGELALVSRYRIFLNADRSYASREEISYGVEPESTDLAIWNKLLSAWVKEL